jgi:hypothetical protein
MEFVCNFEGAGANLEVEEFILNDEGLMNFFFEAFGSAGRFEKDLELEILRRGISPIYG